MYQQELKLAGVETVLFDKIMANPLKSTVMEGAACAKETGCDFIVALGGGSSIDTAAKSINGALFPTKKPMRKSVLADMIPFSPKLQL